MLKHIFSDYPLANILLPYSQWRPYPVAGDRSFWDELHEPTRMALIRAGDQAISEQWPALPANLYLDYSRTGNRSNFQRPYNLRRNILSDLILGYCAKSDDAYLDPIVNAIWSICEESSWCYPAHLGVQKSGSGLPDISEPVVDLFAAETGAQLAWCLYLVGPVLDRVSPLVYPRICSEIRNRILFPCLERDDFWWMGFRSRKGKKGVNNWNPWINSNWLTCALLVEKEPAIRAAHVGKIIQSMDNFIKGYSEDGGCDEGPNYWGRAAGSLFDCLELLHSASGGGLDAFDEPLVGEMGRYIYRMHVGKSWVVNFADASALCRPDPALVYEYGRRIGDPDMCAFGAYLARVSMIGKKSPQGSLMRRLRSLCSVGNLLRAESLQPLPRDTWLPQTQVVASRSAKGVTKGVFYAAKGGHNGESHNHNDIGQFVVFSEGRPLLVDAGVETYTRKTFSENRYDIWTMQSCYHNLPTVNGFTQAPGLEFKARDISCDINDSGVRFSLDIAGAYPEKAGIQCLRRTVMFDRTQGIELTDEWKLYSKPGSLFLTLLTPCGVEEEPGRGLVLLKRDLPECRSTACGSVHFSPGLFDINLEDICLKDKRLCSVWGTKLTRIVMHVLSPDSEGAYTIAIKAG